jgi:hypothetical protein
MQPTNRKRLSDEEKQRIRDMTTNEELRSLPDPNEINYLDLSPEVEDERKRILQIIEAHRADLEAIGIFHRLWNMISTGQDLKDFDPNDPFGGFPVEPNEEGRENGQPFDDDEDFGE